MAYLLQDLIAAVSEPAPTPRLNWLDSVCLLCGGNDCSTLFEAPTLSGQLFLPVVQCQECGLCFTNPRPHPASLEQMLGKEDTPLQPREEWPVRRYHQHGGPFSISRPGKLLDLGSDPTLRDTLRQNGWKICHQHSQSNLEREVYDALHLEHEFDGVNLMYGLQTVGHPMRFLRELRRLLKPDGRLYLRVANIDGLGFWLFGPNWTGLHLPYFVVHLTPWTVQLILERAGFRLLQMSSGWCSAWISRSATTTLRRRLLTLLSFPPFAWMTALHASLTRQADVIAVVATPGQQQ